MNGIDGYVSYLSDRRPGRVSVHGIIGPPEVVVGRVMPTGTTVPRPVLEHSCREGTTTSNDSLAWPAVRLDAFIRIFGDRGGTTRSCKLDFSDAMPGLGEQLHDRLVGQPCLRRPVADPAAPDCELVLTQIGQPPMPLAACDDDASNAPCWRLVSDPACGAPADLRIDAVGIEPVLGRHVQGRCQVLQ
jgi:hypothetical protein